MLIASDWSSYVTAVLPFALLFGVWFFLTNRVQSRNPQQPVIDKLDEIREELVRLRKSIESRP